MISDPRDTLATFLSLLLSELAAVAALGIVFASDVSIGAKLVCFLLVTALGSVRDQIIQANAVAIDASRQERWMAELTMRFGLDRAVEILCRNEHSLVDWGQATSRAMDDMKIAINQRDMERKWLGYSDLLWLSFNTLGHLSIIGIRLAAAWLVSLGVESYAPWMKL